MSEPREEGYYWATLIRSRERVVIQLEREYGKLWAYLCKNEEAFDLEMLIDYVRCIDPLATEAGK